MCPSSSASCISCRVVFQICTFTGKYANLPPAVKKQLQVLAAERETTIQALLAEALNDRFAKYGKPAIAPVEEK